MAEFSLLAAMIFLVGRDTVSSECKVKEHSSPHPYLVRVFGCDEFDPYYFVYNVSHCSKNNTVAHGSLISPDKVITTCTWFQGNPYQAQLTFRVYNSQDNCEQERSALRHMVYEGCNQQAQVDVENVMKNDFSLWLMDRSFDVELKATLWRGQWGGIRPPKLSDMEAIIRKMADSKPSCHAAMFSNASAVDGVVVSDTSVDFINWNSCLSTLEKIFPIDDDPNNKPLRAFGAYRVSCGRDKEISNFKFTPPQQIGNDWRSGAVVVCDVDGKKVPIGMFSRIVAPAPYANTPSFRVTVGFTGSFYNFLLDNVGIQPEPEKNPKQKEEKCELSGENYYPYLLRIVKDNSQDDSQRAATEGHGALIRPNVVLSSCTPYRKVGTPTHYTFWGYNPKKFCVTRRKPSRLYKANTCEGVGEDKILVNDFAIWTTDKPFHLDFSVHYPNLWQGPNIPSINEVVRSILDLSDESYEGFLSRRLATGIFAEPKLFTGDRQQNAEVEFMPWAECKFQLANFLRNWDDIKTEFVEGKQVYPVFCGLENLRGAGPKTNKSEVDWISGAVVMYTYLYVYEWGSEPTTVTIPLGVFSRVVVGQSKDGKNIRVIAAFSRGFHDFMESTESQIGRRYYQSGKSSQPACATLDLRILASGVLVANEVLGLGSRSIHR